MEALESGAVVADMEVIRLLGKGAFGHVYAVNAPGHDRPLALKLMNASVSSESMQRRFQREAEVIQRLESDFVPAIYDFGECDDGSPFILMELLQGQTLGEVVEAEGGKLPWRRVLDLGLQACEALEIAHSVGVLHRDLKPDNLFIVEEQLKILDFGVATFVSGHTDRHGALTQTSAIVGTPHYMSPEQIRSTKIGVEADIYMLGVVLYECLTGKRPFGGEFLGDLLGSVLSGQYRPIAYHAPTTPRVLTKTIQQAMSLDPKDRFPSAEAFGNALRQGHAASSEPPPRPTLSPRSADPEKETLPHLSYTAPSYPADSTASGSSPAPRPRLGLLAAGALVFLVLTAATTYFIASSDAETSSIATEPVGPSPFEPVPPDESESAPAAAAIEPAEPVGDADATPPEVPTGVATPEPLEPEAEAEPVRRPRTPTRMRPVEVEAPPEVEPPPEEPPTEEPPADPEPVTTSPPDGLINPFE
ncbi:MAG: serine/threonine protein kinase [Polyangiales bacterium]